MRCVLNLGCELLSICDLTIFDTPLRINQWSLQKLWIAFNLWFDDLWHTNMTCFTLFLLVVNCFQFVIWRSLTHRRIVRRLRPGGCELLSICDLTIFDTPEKAKNYFLHELWIAFNLWFDDLWHTNLSEIHINPSVVNCFQFVIWRSLTHPEPYHHNHRYVVNCFQFVIWRSLTHPFIFASSNTVSCELLSICDLTIFDTPGLLHPSAPLKLWIAFNLWFDDLWHTSSHSKSLCNTVVNCFQFVIWRSLTHPLS